MPTFFVRIHEWRMAEVAKTYGTIVLLFSLPGPFLAGWVADRMYLRGAIDSSVRLSSLVLLALAGCTLSMTLTSSANFTLVLTAFYTMLLSFLAGLPLASIQLITPNQLRGQVSAIFLFIVNILGMGLGPMLIGVMTDHVFGYEKAVRFSLAIVPSAALLLGSVALRLCCRPFRASILLSHEWTKTQ